MPDTAAHRPNAVGKIGGLLPRAGFIASAITTVCCLGLSAVVSLTSAIGATFLSRDSTLRPLLVVSLVITVAGSAWTYRGHHDPAPLILTLAAGAWIYAALYGSLNQGIGVTHAAGDGHGSHAGHGAAPDAMHDNMTHAAGSHGGLSATALVWIGLTVLTAAQVWDLRRVRACRHPAATAPAPAASAPTTTE